LLWFILAIATALCVATGDALTKKFFGRFSPYDMAVASSLYSLPFLIIYIFFIPIPELDAVFWWIACVLIPLDTFAFYLYMKAIKLSPLSLSIPFLCFTPVFMILTGLIVLNEVPSGWGVIGFFYLAALDITILILFPFLEKIEWRAILKRPGKGMSVGLMLFLHGLFHCLAISMVKAVYMIAVKRMSILFSVVYGWILFKESDIGTRMLGALLMLTGAVFIILLG